ncbi:DUF418 domain-containing protein [Brevibacillus laterosporus]|uniref:DUF418 domain-containing protein n=1 Tax=Brevibacillus laterosporus TaxID=1465 RepID=UPI0035A62108
MNQLQSYKRIDTLDYLRGFALLGIVLMNIIAILDIGIPKMNTGDASYQSFLFLFVESKFITIFSFLFGVGFYLFITKANAKGNNGYILFLRRILALFGIGCIHGIFLNGEVLKEYAIFGIILLLFYKMKKQVNLIIGIVGLIIACTFSIKELVTLPLMLIGLAAGQYRIFENISERRKQVTIFTVIMLLLGMAGVLYQYTQVPSSPFAPIVVSGIDDPETEQVNHFLSIGIMIGPIISSVYVGVLILFLQSRFAQTLLHPLKFYGRMALTNYLGQTFILLAIGHIFHLFNQITYLQSLLLCVVIYVIQILFSVMWMRFFTMGPMEWAWRVITYWKVPPLLKIGNKNMLHKQ